MELQLVRYCYGPDQVNGLLKFGDNLELSVWTVEKPWRENQIFISCVPDGSYPLVAFDSPDHPDCWVLTPVPGRTGILIHVGNTVDDVSGCIAIGLDHHGSGVISSRKALAMLNYKLNRNEQHVIHIGSGMGAQLMPSDPASTLQRHSDEGNGDGSVPSERGQRIIGTPDSPGGSD